MSNVRLTKTGRLGSGRDRRHVSHREGEKTVQRFKQSSQLRQSGHYSRSIRLRSWCQAASLNQDIAKTLNVKGTGRLTDMLETSGSKFIADSNQRHG